MKTKTPIKSWQRWQSKDNGTIFVITKKNGDKWRCYKEGRKTVTHTMSEQTIRRFYELI